MVSPTRLDYCQYLLSTNIHHFADTLRTSVMIRSPVIFDRLTPRLLWEHVKSDLVAELLPYL